MTYSTAEGDLDFKGTLGVDKSAPVGFTAIRVNFDLDCGADTPKEKVSRQRSSVNPMASRSDGQRADNLAGQVEKLISLTERYCVVLQTLKNGVKCDSTLL